MVVREQQSEQRSVTVSPQARNVREQMTGPDAPRVEGKPRFEYEAFAPRLEFDHAAADLAGAAADAGPHQKRSSSSDASVIEISPVCAIVQSCRPASGSPATRSASRTFANLLRASRRRIGPPTAITGTISIGSP